MFRNLAADHLGPGVAPRKTRGHTCSRRECAVGMVFYHLEEHPSRRAAIKVEHQAGVSLERVLKWVRGAQVDEGPRAGHTTSEWELLEGAQTGRTVGARGGRKDFRSILVLFRAGLNSRLRT